MKQLQITLPAFPRGFHSITAIVEKALQKLNYTEEGLLNIFIKHTSASLCINEDADPTVKDEFENYFNKIAPENEPYFKHDYEGSDDMPAHLKTGLLGTSLMIPITQSRLNIGQWQGIYLGEHRNNGGKRKIVLTIL